MLSGQASSFEGSYNFADVLNVMQRVATPSAIRTPSRMLSGHASSPVGSRPQTPSRRPFVPPIQGLGRLTRQDSGVCDSPQPTPGPTPRMPQTPMTPSLHATPRGGPRPGTSSAVRGGVARTPRHTVSADGTASTGKPHGKASQPQPIALASSNNIKV